MRRPTTYILPLLVPIVVGALFLVATNSCKLENVVETAEQTRSTGCRLASRTLTNTNSTSPYSQNTNWLYNENTTLAQYTSPQTIGQYPTRVDFKYNADGYLIETTQVIVYVGTFSLFNDTLTTKYEYAKGKLVREETSKGLFGKKGIISYEYDKTGELTKMVDDDTFWGDKKSYVFSAGKLIDYVILYDGSNAEVRPYQLTNGQIVREYGRDRRYYTGYQYDEQGRPTKIERVDGDRVTEYHTYSYTDGKAYFDATPLPKGWPTVSRKKFIYEELLPGLPVTPIGLPVSWTRYKPTRPGSTELFKNIVKEYSHIKNEQGYPVRSEYITTVYTSFGEAVGTPSRVAETYIYEGCP